MTCAWLQSTAATPYVRRADLSSDNLGEGFSLDEEIMIGAYCLDRPVSSPTGGACLDGFLFDECATSRIDNLENGF